MKKLEQKFKNNFPFFKGLLPIKTNELYKELFAGLTLAVISIPEVMGYTKISGTPIITGIYSLLFPMLIFAVLGASRHLVVAADSATAAIMAQALIPFAAVGSAEYLSYACLLAIMVGVILLVCWLLRLGFISKFLSHTVLVGFLTGVGIQVALGQFGGMLGINTTGSHVVEQAASVFLNINKTNINSIAIATFTVVIILIPQFFEKKAPLLRKIPWALLAIIITSYISYRLCSSGIFISSVGTIPPGFPHFVFPIISYSRITKLVTAAVTIVIVIITQSAATSSAYANRYNEVFDENADMLGLGFANVVAGFSGTFVVNGSPTKTEIADSAGGRSQIANISAIVVVAAVLLFLTDPLKYLPTATLCGLVFCIGLRLINIQGMKQIYNQKRNEFWVALLTAAIVVVIGAAQGIIFAMVFAMIEHIYRGYKPHNSLMVNVKKDDYTIWTWQPLASKAQAMPGLVVYHFAASIYYANVDCFAEEVSSLAKNILGLKNILIDFSAIADVDFTGGEVITELIKKLAAQNVNLCFVRVEQHVMDLLTAYGIIDLIGTENIYSHIEVAMAFLTNQKLEQ